ncbi:relaxase MobL [Ruminococcus sp. Marseille-P6503]|uniref:relaxase MobL n=1 Tax=Ruminococcus sp. Marseille-P6503 TaxID=2364796 RepID=UPI000F54269C|nr:relaxase MobL [Ruminococcus sp. Marseille-P6503]
MSVNTISKLKPGNPRPGIIFSLGFEYNWKIGGYDFLEYMERPEAFNPIYHLNDEFNPQNRYKGGDFLTYMSNEEKSDGLFDNEKDRLTQTDKQRYRRLERVSRDEGCPKYFGVVSFDNQFLLEHGILTQRGDGHFNLDVKKLKELGRLGINKMISENSKFDADNVYWNAAIHTNTDNIHIHYSICEYHRKEDRKITQKGNKQDCIDVKAFNALKSAIANRIIGNEHVKQLTELRDIIRKGVRAYGPKEQLLKLMMQLPENVLKSSKQKCGYNSGYVKRYRPLIDSITDSAIRSDPELFRMGKLFSEMTEKSQLLYRKTYGVGNQALYKNFRKNKMNDLKERCGNEVLNAVREIYREQLAHPSEEELKTGSFAEQFEAAQDPSSEEVFPEPPFPSEEQLPDEYYASLYSSEPEIHPSEEDTQLGLLAEQSEAADYEPPFPDEEQLPDEYYASLFSSEPEIHPSEEEFPKELAFEEQPDYERTQDHPSEETVFINWSKEYKEALHFLYGNDADPNNIIKSDPEKALKLLFSECNKGNMLAAYDIGKIYAEGLAEAADSKDIGEWYYAKALNGFKEILAQDMQLLENAYAVEAKGMKKKRLEHVYLHYRIGSMYLTGKGTAVDLDNSEKHLIEAANTKNPNAQYALGKLYQNEHKKDLDKAEHFLMLAAKQNDKLGIGHYALGKLYLTEEKYNLNKAEEHLLLSAKKDNMYAQYALGKLYQSDDKKDLDKAEDYLMLAAAQDDELGIGHYALGKLYLTEEKYNLDKAEKHLLLSAQKGNMYAQYALGKLYQSDDKKDLDKAEDYLMLAAAQDDELGIGHYALGKLYLTEEKYNLDKAEKHLLLSAQKGNMYAQYALGKLYQSDDKKDLDKAEDYLMLAAAQDDKLGIAHYALGKLYLTEEKYDQDNAEEHLLLSAQKDNMYAQYTLGKLYQNEHKKDLDKAEYYLMLAAKQDDKLGICHYALGKLYLTEEKYDLDKAEEHLLLSAEKDNMYAQYALGKLYQSDDKKDLDKAEHFLMLAAAQDDELGIGHYALGKLYLTEEKYDLDKAEEHLLLSAEKNNMYAQYALGKLYLNPEKYSWEKAEAMLLTAAQQNNQYAQARLGVEYFKRHEFEKGREQLKKAAEQGNKFAAEYLAKPLKLPSGYIDSKKQLAICIDPAFIRMLNEMQRHTQQLINEYEYEEALQLMQNRNY